jgi:hypothetical protein
MSKELLLIGLWSIFLIVEVLRNGFIIRTGVSPNHFTNGEVRALALALLLLLTRGDYPIWWVVFFSASFFWLPYDVLLNVFRWNKLPKDLKTKFDKIIYVGRKADPDEDSWIDGIQEGREFPFFVWKLFLFVASIYGTITYYDVVL